jgi:hypothetical protein
MKYNVHTTYTYACIRYITGLTIVPPSSDRENRNTLITSTSAAELNSNPVEANSQDQVQLHSDAAAGSYGGEPTEQPLDKEYS